MTNIDNIQVCSNCDQEFDKEYAFCPHCGQKNKKQRIGQRTLSV